MKKISSGPSAIQEGISVNGKLPFRCPKCGYRSYKFRMVCPGCGRRFVRDHTDTKMYPRDPNPTGVCMSRFWIWVFLLFTLGGIVLGLILNLGLLSGVGQ